MACFESAIQAPYSLTWTDRREQAMSLLYRWRGECGCRFNTTAAVLFLRRRLSYRDFLDTLANSYSHRRQWLTTLVGRKVGEYMSIQWVSLIAYDNSSKHSSARDPTYGSSRTPRYGYSQRSIVFTTEEIALCSWVAAKVHDFRFIPSRHGFMASRTCKEHLVSSSVEPSMKIRGCRCCLNHV